MAITGIPLDDKKTGTDKQPLGGSVQSPTPDTPTVPGGMNIGFDPPADIKSTGTFGGGTQPIGIGAPKDIKSGFQSVPPIQHKPPGDITGQGQPSWAYPQSIGIADPKTVTSSSTVAKGTGIGDTPGVNAYLDAKRKARAGGDTIGITPPADIKSSGTYDTDKKKDTEKIGFERPEDIQETGVTPEQQSEIRQAEVNDQLKEIGDLAKRMMNGEMVDTAFNKQLNNYIGNISLFNAADMATLSQQVAADPNLKGTGLGYALLAQAGRDAGMRVSDMLGKLSVESARNMMELQKFGIGKALEVTGKQEGIRQWDETQKESIRRWEENMDYQREGRDYARMGDAINLAMTSGDFGSAAKGINDFASKHFPGMGISVTASSLASRDPHFAQDFVDDMNNIKDLASRDPLKAKGMLENMMANTMYDGMFTENITADQIIESIVSGQYGERQEFEAGAVLDLNEFAADDWDTLSLDANATIDYDRIMETQDERETRRIVDWTDQAEDLTIQDVKDVYKSEGLTEPTDEEAAAILADTESSRTVAKKKDYLNRVNEAEDNISIKNEMIKALQGAGMLEDYIKDPQLMADFESYWAAFSTGNEDAEVPWLVEDGDSYSYVDWKTWPSATFDTQTGEVINTGYKGGHYLTDSSVAAMTEADPNWETKNADLDQAYRAYRGKSEENTLSAPEWYYATAGGTLPPNEDNIPGNIEDPPPPPPPPDDPELTFADKVDELPINATEQSGFAADDMLAKDYKDKIDDDKLARIKAIDERVLKGTTGLTSSTRKLITSALKSVNSAAIINELPDNPRLLTDEQKESYNAIHLFSELVNGGFSPEDAYIYTGNKLGSVRTEKAFRDTVGMSGIDFISKEA